MKNEQGITIKLYRIENFLYKHHMKVLARIIYGLIYMLFNCVIPPQIEIGIGSTIPHSVGIVLNHKAKIGKCCKIYQNVTLANGGITIGDNVIIGTGAVIMGPCMIGDNAKIGALTFVNFDVPEGCTVVGTKGSIIEK